MKKIITIMLFTMAMLASKPSQANEELVTLLIQSQGLTEQQEGLAVNVYTSFKDVAGELKAGKGDLTGYFLQVANSDQLDATAAYEAYKQWQSNIDIKVLQLLESMSRLHADLSPEQKQALLQKLVKAHKKAE